MRFGLNKVFLQYVGFHINKPIRHSKFWSISLSTNLLFLKSLQYLYKKAEGKSRSERGVNILCSFVFTVPHNSSSRFVIYHQKSGFQMIFWVKSLNKFILKVGIWIT